MLRGYLISPVLRVEDGPTTPTLCPRNEKEDFSETGNKLTKVLQPRVLQEKCPGAFSEEACPVRFLSRSRALSRG